MIRPLRRYHRRLIAAIVVTLTLAALIAITHQAPDARMDTLPAQLDPSPYPLPSKGRGEAGPLPPKGTVAAAPSPRRGPGRADCARWGGGLRGEGWGEGYLR